MNSIIPITPQIIGTEETNAVNARDLHKTLKSRKQFANWIKAQIESLGLEENSDYVLLNQKVKQKKDKSVLLNQKVKQRGGHNAIDYILTLDTAKHIAMASRSPKGKEVRQYFIEVEKAWRLGYMAHKPAPDPQITAQVDRLVETFDHRIEQLHEEVHTLRSLVQYDSNIIERNTRAFERFRAVVSDMPISREQMRLLREEVEDRGRTLARQHGISSEVTIPAIFRALNRNYDIRTYTELDPRDYYSATRFIRHFTLQKDAS